MAVAVRLVEKRKSSIFYSSTIIQLLNAALPMSPAGIGTSPFCCLKGMMRLDSCGSSQLVIAVAIIAVFQSREFRATKQIHLWVLAVSESVQWRRGNGRCIPTMMNCCRCPWKLTLRLCRKAENSVSKQHSSLDCVLVIESVP